MAIKFSSLKSHYTQLSGPGKFSARTCSLLRALPLPFLWRVDVARLPELRVGPVRVIVWLPNGEPTLPLGHTKLGLPKVGLLTTKLGLKLLAMAGWVMFWLRASSCLLLVSMLASDVSCRRKHSFNKFSMAIGEECTWPRSVPYTIIENVPRPPPALIV